MAGPLAFLKSTPEITRQMLNNVHDTLTMRVRRHLQDEFNKHLRLVCGYISLFPLSKTLGRSPNCIKGRGRRSRRAPLYFRLLQQAFRFRQIHIFVHNTCYSSARFAHSTASCRISQHSPTQMFFPPSRTDPKSSKVLHMLTQNVGASNKAAQTA